MINFDTNEFKLPLKVKFKKHIFDDSFIEEGMIAYLTKIEVEDVYENETCYKLHFNQEEFISHNEELLIDCYHYIPLTAPKEYKSLYNAKDIGVFYVKWEEYLGVVQPNETMNSVMHEYFEFI